MTKGWSRKKYLIVSVTVLILSASWIYYAIADRKEKEQLNLQADAAYFGDVLPTIKIGDQLCNYSGADPDSKKNMYLCADGQYYVHKDWH